MTSDFENYRFSEDINKELIPLFELNNYSGVLMLLEDYLVISASITLSIWTWYSHEPLGGLLIYLFCVINVGCRMRAIAEMLHDASHYALAKNRPFNMVLGSVFSGWLVGQSFSGYKNSHTIHHSNLGNPALDPDYVALMDFIYGKKLTPQDFYQYLMSLFSPMIWLDYLKYLWTHRINQQNEDRTEFKFRMAFYIIAISLFIWTNTLHYFVFYWLAPLITTASIVGAFSELLEHYPFMETRPKVSIFMSRNRDFGPLFNFFFACHNKGWHLIHHLFPALPAQNMIKAHEILLRDPVYREQNQDNSFFGILRDVYKDLSKPLHAK